MSLSAFSYLVSAMEFLAAVSFLVAPAQTARWFVKLKEEDALVRVVGAFFFVITFLVLSRGIAIGLDVPGLVRIAVWIGAVKSLLLCWWPERLLGRMDRVFSRPALTRAFGLLALAAGVVFLLAGDHLQGLGM